MYAVANACMAGNMNYYNYEHRYNVTLMTYKVADEKTFSTGQHFQYTSSTCPAWGKSGDFKRCKVILCANM